MPRRVAGLGIAVVVSAATLAAVLLDRPEPSVLATALGPLDPPQPKHRPTPRVDPPPPDPKPALKERPEPAKPTPPRPGANASPKADIEPELQRRLAPPGPGATRAERVEYARQVVERIRRSAQAESNGRAGRAKYPDEEATKQPLVLSAIVDPTDSSPFAVIEHEDAGFVSSYRPGTMIWPGILPGVWVIDIRPGVVHLLDLESSSFEFLTFEEPMSPAERRAAQRRERARKRREEAKRRREARKRKQRR